MLTDLRSAPSNPRPAEWIWSMQKSGRRIDCELQTRGDAGCDCQIFDEDDWCLYRCHWAGRAEALTDAENQREALVRNGWTRGGECG
jgi:hypothetical protein